MANTLLKVSGLKVAYGGIKAVKGIDLEVREGELISLIGSNGAGKTTTMKAVTGSLAMEGGDVEYLGQSIKGKGAWDLVRQGLAGGGSRFTRLEGCIVGDGRVFFTATNGGDAACGRG